MIKEGMILRPNENHMETVFGDPHDLVVTQVGLGRVFADDLVTGEHLEISDDNFREEGVLYYYNIVS